VVYGTAYDEISKKERSLQICRLRKYGFELLAANAQRPFFFADVGLAGAFFAEIFLERGFLGAALGGGAAARSGRGGTARIRHFGPEPIKSSRWAFRRASRTK
jgi:hypothetical protein